ncbi:hypothetical protein Efla_000518 [Eimeria flavescens]
MGYGKGLTGTCCWGVQRCGSQEKQLDCLSRAPLPPSPDQRPIVLEFADRMLVHVRAVPPQPSPCVRLWCQNLCLAVQRQAQRCHVEARLVRHRQYQEPPFAPLSSSSPLPMRALYHVTQARHAALVAHAGPVGPEGWEPLEGPKKAPAGLSVDS